jgi:hypothetical protein
MSLALFGLLLLAMAVALAWKAPRAAFAALVGVLLGVVLAGSDGALASVAHQLVDGIRSTVDGIGADIFS